MKKSVKYVEWTELPEKDTGLYWIRRQTGEVELIYLAGLIEDGEGSRVRAYNNYPSNEGYYCLFWYQMPEWRWAACEIPEDPGPL